MRLRFRAPGSPCSIAELLQRALPRASAEARSDLVARGQVYCDGRGVRRARFVVEAGRLVEVAAAAEEWPSANAEAKATAGVDGRFAFVALTPLPHWLRGELHVGGARIDYEVGEQRDGICALHIESDDGDSEVLASALAAAGFPVLGDLRNGGVLVGDGRRLRAVADVRCERGWPQECVFAGTEPGAPPSFRISSAARRALHSGHPWLLRDDESDAPERFAPGTLVELVGADAQGIGLARVEGGERVSARMWARDVGRPRDAQSVESRVAAALERRRSLLRSAGGARRTDAYRLIHGEADALPGLAVDRLGGALRVLVTGGAARELRERSVDAIVGKLVDELGPNPPVVEVIHTQPRPAGRFECVRLLRGDLEGLDGYREGRWPVWERGLRFWVDPGLSHPFESHPGVGLYTDQRDNRARLANLAREGGRWLNLFAHTGAFSVALLAAGADEVVSVDLSAAYLAWLEENLALNGPFGGRHLSVQRDGRRHLAEEVGAPGFDGIVLDPPTAAAAGRRFWSLKRDLLPLLQASVAHLRPGGALLVSRNDRSGPRDWSALVRTAAKAAGARVASLEEMAPTVDYPRLKAFPEGDIHRALLLRRG